MYQSYLKLLFDLIIALIGLLFLIPIFILVTIGLYFANNGKPFFFQTRPGKNEQLFKEKNDSFITEIFYFTNDIFLKSNQQEGSVTYSYFIDLLVLYERRKA